MLGSKSAKCITPILALCFLFGCNDNSTDISSMSQVEQPKPVSSSNQGAQPKPVSTSNQGVQPKPASTSNQGVQPKPVSTSNQGVQPKPVSTSNQGAQPKPVSTSNQGAQPKPVSTSNQGAQPKPVSTSNQGAQPKPVSTSNQGTQTKQCPQTPEKELIKCKLTTTFHLLPDDANYVIKYHGDVAKQVVNTPDPVLTGIEFIPETIPSPLPSYIPSTVTGPMQWPSQAKINVKRMLGQIIFVLNTPKFKERFNTAGLGLMNPDAFKGGESIPLNYQDFQNVINSAISGWKNDGNQNTNTYHLYLFQSLNNDPNKPVDAYAVPSEPIVILRLDSVQNTNQNGLLHRSASLVAHELMHTVDYRHVGFSDMTPNNVPYYVQAITWTGGMNSTDCDRFMTCLQDMKNHRGAPTTNFAATSDADPKDQSDSKLKYTNIFAMYFGSSDIPTRNRTH